MGLLDRVMIVSFCAMESIKNSLSHAHYHLHYLSFPWEFSSCLIVIYSVYHVHWTFCSRTSILSRKHRMFCTHIVSGVFLLCFLNISYSRRP